LSSPFDALFSRNLLKTFGRYFFKPCHITPGENAILEVGAKEQSAISILPFSQRSAFSPRSAKP
jgi:hypothetical protein